MQEQARSGLLRLSQKALGIQYESLPMYDSREPTSPPVDSMAPKPDTLFVLKRGNPVGFL